MLMASPPLHSPTPLCSPSLPSPSHPCPLHLDLTCWQPPYRPPQSDPQPVLTSPEAEVNLNLPDLTYVGEGADHIVLRLATSGQVLRLRKTSVGAVTSREELILRAARDEAFLVKVARPILGPLLTDTSRLVEVDRRVLGRLKATVEPARQGHRQNKEINKHGVACICPDASTIFITRHNNSSHLSSPASQQCLSPLITATTLHCNSSQASLTSASSSGCCSSSVVTSVPSHLFYSPSSSSCCGSSSVITLSSQSFSSQTISSSCVSSHINGSSLNCSSSQSSLQLSSSCISSPVNTASFSNQHHNHLLLSSSIDSSPRSSHHHLQTLVTTPSPILNTNAQSFPNQDSNLLSLMVKVESRTEDDTQHLNDLLTLTTCLPYANCDLVSNNYVQMEGDTRTVKSYCENTEKMDGMSYGVQMERGAKTVKRDSENPEKMIGTAYGVQMEKDARIVKEDSDNTERIVRMVYPKTPKRVCVEIKPKQGFLDHSTPNLPLCRYCVKQFLKRGKEGLTRSSYCPLDLFSGDVERMRIAVDSLIQSPQNNFKVFEDGEPKEDCRPYKYLRDVIIAALTFNFSSGVAQVGQAARLSGRSPLGRILFFQSLDRLGVFRAAKLYDELSGRAGSEQAADCLLQNLSSWPFSALPHLSTTKNCVQNSNKTINLNDKNALMQNNGLCLPQETQSRLVIPRECKNLQSGEAMESNHEEEDEEIREIVQELQRYLVSTTAKDLSLMVLLSGPFTSGLPESTQANVSPFAIQVEEGLWFKCQVTGVDLVAKPSTKILKHEHDYEKLRNALVDLRSRGEAPKCCGAC